MGGTLTRLPLTSVQPKVHEKTRSRLRKASPTIPIYPPRDSDTAGRANGLKALEPPKIRKVPALLGLDRLRQTIPAPQENTSAVLSLRQASP